MKKGQQWLNNSIEKDSLIDKSVKKNGIEQLYTKHEMAKNLINNHTFFNEGDVVMNSSYGDGAFYDNLPEHVEKYYCELDEGIDYLENNKMVDITLDNPPFTPRKLFWSFMVKAMETTRREIYWLVSMNCINVLTPKRLDEMKEKGWYVKSFHITQDKRWYGRYIWVRITKNPSDSIFSWERKVY